MRARRAPWRPAGRCSAQHASWRPLVQTQKSEPSYGARPLVPPARNDPRSTSSTSRGSDEPTGLEARAHRVGVRREDPEAVAVGRGAEAADQQDLGAVLGGAALELARRGRRGGGRRAAPRRPTGRRARAAARCGRGWRCRGRARRAAGSRRRSGTPAGVVTRSPSSPSRTSRRHSTRLLCGSSGRSAGVSSPRARISSSAGRTGPAPSACGRRAAPRPGRRGRAARTGVRAGGAAGWRRVDRLAAEHVVQPAGEPRRPRGQEPPDLRPRPRRSRRPVVRRRRAASSRSASASASSGRVVEVAGGQVVVGDVGEHRLARCARPGRAR